MENMKNEVSPGNPNQPDRSNRVAITAIIAGSIIILACLAACTAIAIVFLMTPPWA